jgi:hypothetical protein
VQTLQIINPNFRGKSQEQRREVEVGKTQHRQVFQHRLFRIIDLECADSLLHSKLKLG